MKAILENAIERLLTVNTVKDFESLTTSLKQNLIQVGASTETIKMIDTTSYYMTNDFSAKATFDNLTVAKDRLINYLQETLKSNANTTTLCIESRLVCLKSILDNFYLFIEAFFESSPHGRAGIKKDQLAAIKIKNEYDVQHILYALIKPLFPEARVEVTEDTGFSTVRCDIWIKELSAVIEVKCSRDSMSVRHLTEEIASDMIHYTANNIYFFIYDKNKIIGNPHAFKSTYEKDVDGKHIYVILHQPKTL